MKHNSEIERLDRVVGKYKDEILNVGGDELKQAQLEAMKPVHPATPKSRHIPSDPVSYQSHHVPSSSVPSSFVRPVPSGRVSFKTATPVTACGGMRGRLDNMTVAPTL